jgi:hypothetical protein
MMPLYFQPQDETLKLSCESERQFSPGTQSFAASVAYLLLRRFAEHTVQMPVAPVPVARIRRRIKSEGYHDPANHRASYIRTWVFYAVSVALVTISNSLTNIGHNAFDNCVNRTSVTILNHLKRTVPKLFIKRVNPGGGFLMCA